MIHLMAYHFSWALGIPALSRTKKWLQAQSTTDTDNEDEWDTLALSECDEDLDVEVSMDIDAMEHDGKGFIFIFIFICLRAENPLILGLGKCGGRDMVPVWSCVSYRLTPPTNP